MMVPARVLPREPWRTGILAVVVGGAIVVAMFALTRPNSSIPTTVSGTAAVGAMAPDFTTQQLDGSALRLDAFKGKPVLINFWATSCAPCQTEMPAIESQRERYAADGLTVVAIDYRETDRAAMHKFLAGVGAHFDVGLDPDATIATAYGVTIGLPVSVFVERSGLVSYIQLGQMTPEVLTQHLQSILSS